MNKIAPHNTKIFTWFNLFHGLQFFSPIAIIYFAKITGSYAIAGSVLSVAFIAQLLFELPTGILSDKRGRKTAATYGALAYFISIAFYAIGQNAIFLFVGAIFEGLRNAFFSGNNDSLLYESSIQDGEKNYHHNMGRSESFFHMAATVSAISGGLIALVSLRMVFVISLLPAFAMILVSLKFIEPHHTSSIKKKSLLHVSDSIRFLFKNSRLRLTALASSLEFGIGHALFGLQMAFVNSIWPIWAVGISRALSGISATISFAISGKIVEKNKPIKTVLLSGLWSRCMTLIGTVKPTIASPAILSLSSLSFGSSTVAESTMLHKEFSSEQRATLGSLTSLLGSFFFAVGSILLGLIADNYGLQSAMMVGALSGFVSLLMFWRLKKM